MTPPKPEPLTLEEFSAALADVLGLPADTPAATLLAKLKEKLAADPDPSKFMPVAAVQSMLEARMQERLTLSTAQAQDKVDRACRDGYISPAMRGWALSLCRSDEAAFDAFVSQSGPVFAHFLKPLLPSGPPPGLDRGTAAHASDLERAVCEQLGLKPGSLSG